MIGSFKEALKSDYFLRFSKVFIVSKVEMQDLVAKKRIFKSVLTFSIYPVLSWF